MALFLILKIFLYSICLIPYIKYLIESLNNTHNIKLEQIRLACIECKTNQLIELSELYSNLTIYTTKIIET